MNLSLLALATATLVNPAGVPWSFSPQSQPVAGDTVPPVLALPDPALDDTAGYRGYVTRFYRDAAGDAVQVYIDHRLGRVVNVWADALDESIGFTLRDGAGGNAGVTWGSSGAVPGPAGAFRTLSYRLDLGSPTATIGLFLLGSMRVERDFHYAFRDSLPFDSVAFSERELTTLIHDLGALPDAERRRELAILGVTNTATLTARLGPALALIRHHRGWVLRIDQVSFDGRRHLRLTIAGDPGTTATWADSGLAIRVSGPGTAKVIVTIATDAPALTPVPRGEMFNDDFRRFYARVAADMSHPVRIRRLEREVRGAELLTYREKVMAGLPNYGTYFGRDGLMTALMMWPVWAPASFELVIGSALRKLRDDGNVSHEEALGGQAIREHAALYHEAVTRRDYALARGILSALGTTRENYRMVDDDVQLPVVVAEYLTDPRIPASRKRHFLLAGDRLKRMMANLTYVAREAAPYTKDPVATNLVSFPRGDDGSWVSSSWRDSRVGYAGGRFAMDVNAIWMPKALESIDSIIGALRRLGVYDSRLAAPLSVNLPVAIATWRKAIRHFEVAISRDQVRRDVGARLDAFPDSARRYWSRVAADESIPDTLVFLALSLDSVGHPIPVLSTDQAMALLTYPPDPLVAFNYLNVLLRPYPVGLFVPGLGPVVANDAYADPGVWQAFAQDAYHSPAVVWGRDVNIILAAMSEAILATDSMGRPAADTLRVLLDTVATAVQRSRMGYNELWSYRVTSDSLHPERYGVSSDVQLWTLTDIAVQYLLAELQESGMREVGSGKSEERNGRYDPAHDLGSLFQDVQLRAVFPDSKTFVDAVPKAPPAQIVARYDSARGTPGFDLRTFVTGWFALAPSAGEGYHSDTTQTMERHIQSLWDVLTRTPPARDTLPERSSLIPLPEPYLVPGGRFREIYYWDSYFEMLGLVADSHLDLAREMLDNFAYLIRTVGHIPNGNRTYYLSRSQAPFFGAMVGLYARATDTARALQYLDALEAEHAFWMEGVSTLARGHAYRRVVRLASGDILNRYWDDLAEPRAESYREDYTLAQGVAAARRPELYRRIRASAESGWDFSSRWMRDTADLRSLETTDLAPVDLNSLLYYDETLIAALRRFRGAAGDLSVATRFGEEARDRRRALLAAAYDSSAGYFFDVRWSTGERVTDRPTMAAVYPLYFGLATREEARGVAAELAREFLRPGGFTTTLIRSGQQWDIPNGWPPLQWLAIQGLRRYGDSTLADSARARWLAVNRRVYDATDKMVEKYDVLDIARRAGGGEYPAQDGFGWTNGVAVALLADTMVVLRAP
ncbi:MAG TPA: alpha,alpha-trehalase TreF [Gemmatimonadales bacterium]|nr:alpha,alpha-trehalase TreF [Gemmatimonadales bacterium]